MPSRSRRALLQSLASGSAALLAGCDAGPPTRTETATATSSDTPTTTGTATATEPPLRCGPVVEASSNWPLPARSAAGDNYGGTGDVFVSAPSVAWSIEPTVPPEVDALPGFSQPVVVDDWLYSSNVLEVGPQEDDPAGHTLEARVAGNGETHWRHELPRTPSPPSVWDDDVLVATARAVHAVDRRDGTERWVRGFDHLVRTFVPAGGRCVVTLDVLDGDAATVVHALRVDGTTAWTRRLDHDATAGPTVAGDRVYLALRGGTLLALDRTDGATQWTADTGQGGAETGTIYPTSVVATDCAVVTVTEGDLSAHSTDGRLLWRNEGEFGPLATDGTTIYDASDPLSGPSRLRALDAGTGALKWEQPHAVEGYEPPVATDTAVYAAADDDVLAVSASDGTTRWVTEPPLENLALAGDTLYGTAGGTLVALG